MQKKENYLNITKKDLTKKYIRETFTYQKLLQEVERTFGVSNRNYYVVYYKSNTGSPRYLRNKKQFQESIIIGGVDELFIEKREQGEEILEDSGKDSKKTQLYNQSLTKALQQLRLKHRQSISALNQQIKDEMNKRLEKKSLQLKNNYQRIQKRKINLKEWKEKCSICKRGIKGVKYECASCQFYACQKCERDKPNHEPTSTHVLIKIVDEKHQTNNKKLKDIPQKKKFVLEKQTPSKADISNDINTLVEILQISKTQAVQLIKKNIGKDVNQLIDLHLQ